MSFVQRLLGPDFINKNEGKFNLRELEASLKQALSQENLNPEVRRFAGYFAQNPEAIANMADCLEVELVTTSPCDGGCGDHLESDEEGLIKSFKSSFFTATGRQPPPIPFHGFSGLLTPERWAKVFLINDRDGHLKSLPFKEEVREKILSFVIPQIKASIPEAVGGLETPLKALQQALATDGLFRSFKI
jgi:hypothetical protein